MRLPLGPDDLSVGEVRIVPHAAGDAPRKSLLLTNTKDGLRCYWNVCQHLPIPLDGGTGSLAALVCLTHGAEYRPSDGYCFAGPCEGDHLEAVEIEVDAGEVYALL